MGRKKKGQDFLDLPEIGGDADGEHASDETATAKALATAPTSGSKKKGKKGKNKGAAADWDSDNEPGVEASRSGHLSSTSAADGGGSEENGKHLGESAGSDAEDGVSPPADVAMASRKAAKKKKERKGAASAFAALAMDDDDAEEEEESDSAEPSNTLQALQDEEEAGSGDAESGPALVAAEIIKVSKHPKKDTLRVCSVNTGGETVTVVTNVKDVRAGEVVVLARVGATTPGSGMLVDARELKGVRSQGMFCSAYDIGWVDAPDNQLVRLPASFRAGDACPVEQPGSPSTSGRPAQGAFDQLQEEAEGGGQGEDAASAFAALLGEAAGSEHKESSSSSDGKKGKKGKKAKKQPDSAAAAFALLEDEPQEEEEEEAAEGGGAAAAFAALAVEAEAEEPEEELEMDRAAPSSKSTSKKSKKDKKKKKQEDETGGADMFALLGEADEMPEEPEEEEVDGAGGTAAAAFAALVGEADEVAGDADAEPEEAAAASKKKGKKDKKKKKKLEKAAEDDDLDALLAEIDGPAAGSEEPAAAPEEAAVAEEPAEPAEAAEPAETGKKGKKKKKGQVKKQDDEDLDALLAEFGAAPAAKPAEQAPADAAGAPEPAGEEPGEAADVAEGEEGGTKELTANQKKKLKKKQKEKEKKAATGTAEEEGGEPAAAAAAGKKGGKKVSAAKLRLLQEIEARERREREAREAEEEALRLEEEERQREEEEERRKEEEKAKRKEAKRLAKEQAKKEGRLLTAKQKEDERRREAVRQQMLAQAAEKGVSVPDAMDADDKPKKKPIYDNKKKSAAKKREEEEARKRAEEEEARLAALEEERVRKQQQQEQEQKRREEEAAAQAAAKAEAEVEDSWEDAVLDDWEAADEVELAAPVTQADAKEKAEPSMEVVGAKAAAAAKAALDSAAAEDDDEAKEEEEAEEEEEEEEDEEESDEDEEDSDEEDDSSEEEEDSSSEEDSSEEESLDSDEIREEKLEALKEKLAGKLAQAKEAAHKDDLRSPICCILGHVDTGKTKILDNIRRTNVQEGEAGGITQQIGATYIPREAVENRTQELRNGRELNMKMPGLLVIDTPGHESFTNLRTRGSGLCDMAVLVVDIMHGLEQQTIESIGLLKMRKTPFVIALNKVDRLYQWKSKPNAAIRESLKRQNRQTMQEYEERLAATKLALNEQGLNVELYWKNPDPRKFVNLIPTSAITGEGIPDLMQLVVKLTQTMMAERLMYIEYMQCTVLEVKVIEGYGHTIDVVLVNGTLRQGDRIVLCGLEGPIVSSIRSLLTPQPLKELRVKNAYTKHPQVKAAQGIKISAQDLEKAVAGTQLYVIKKGDDEQAYKDLVMEDMKSIFESVDKSGEGVCVQASTLGSLEALLEFLKSDAVKIPVSGINIGPVHKKDVMRANVMMEKGQRKFACILAFDVPVTRDAEDLARNLGIRVFTADIIYHLFDQFSAYVNEVRAQELQVARRDAVFPCVLEIVPNCVFNAKDPIVLGVNVVEGQAHVGTPLCVPSRDGIMIGRIASMEKDHRPVDVCKVGDSCAMKIEGQNAEEQSRLVGRHFTEQDQLVSRVSRASINILKQHFREEMAKDDWRLVVRLKSVFKIDGPGG